MMTFYIVNFYRTKSTKTDMQSYMRIPFLTPYQKKNQINFAYTAPLRLSKARPPAAEHIKPQNAAPNISCNIKKKVLIKKR